VSNFDEIYQQVALTRKGEAVSAELRSKLAAVHTALVHHPPDVAVIKQHLIALLSFLTTPSGRTNANCWAVDLFFVLLLDSDIDWPDLPEAYQEVLSNIGGALHDTIEYPEIADNFSSTPEQLLERAVALLTHIQTT
jgi:hypothetical protein